jgi:hypothetical protein
MNAKLQRNLEGSVPDLIYEISQHLSGGSEENKKILNQETSVLPAIRLYHLQNTNLCYVNSSSANILIFST